MGDGAVARLNVVAGILRDKAGRVLIAERIGDTPLAGLWEFPGGKVDPGETPGAALCRELREEIGIEVLDYDYYFRGSHEYPDRHVVIEFYLVRRWQREPAGLEGQGLRWCRPAEVDAAELLPANEGVLQALRASASVTASAPGG